jgi:hypothetical protein
LGAIDRWAREEVARWITKKPCTIPS